MVVNGKSLSFFISAILSSDERIKCVKAGTVLKHAGPGVPKTRMGKH